MLFRELEKDMAVISAQNRLEVSDIQGDF